MAGEPVGNTMSKEALRAELDQLLSEDVASAKRREKATYDELVAPHGDRLVLFGAGNLGRRTLAGLRKLGIEPLAFSDNNPAAWGKQVEGIDVVSPQDAADRFGNNAAFLLTIWGGHGTDRMSARCDHLRRLGCDTVVPFAFLYWKHPDLYLPHYALDVPHKVLLAADDVRAAFELFNDEASLREFVGQIRWRLTLDFDALPLPVEHEIYFPDDLTKVTPDEVFVDCGAYDGDTAKRFLERNGNRFASFIAFEPDPVNFRHLEEAVAAAPAPIRTKVSCEPYAVGARTEKVRFEATGTASSSVGQGSLELDCVTLDEALGGRRPTWIKMDIESAEIDALKGAEKTIRTNLPVLAICVYHLQDHVWKIPLQIHRLSSDYRLFLRPHVIESWDLVCYAIPPTRLGMQTNGRG